jgi:hypothetical protein
MAAMRNLLRIDPGIMRQTRILRRLEFPMKTAA